VARLKINVRNFLKVGTRFQVSPTSLLATFMPGPLSGRKSWAGLSNKLIYSVYKELAR